MTPHTNEVAEISEEIRLALMEIEQIMKKRLITDQPTGIELSVCLDIADRQRKGIAKYGTTVAANPLELKQWLQHAYEETLDKAVYLKRAIAELDKDNVKIF